MKTATEHAAINRLLQKEVAASTLLHDFSTDQGCTLFGPGSIQLVCDAPETGGASVLAVRYPNSVPRKYNTNRSYDCARLRLFYEEADWQAYNRVSFWIYPVQNGFKNFWVSVELKNEGEHAYPRPDRLEGVHFVNVTAGQWNQVVWEIPDIPRDKVSMLQINFEVRGMQANMALESCAYLRRLELQTVKADKFAGWDTDGKIVFCHSGYAPGAQKLASISAPAADTFSVVDNKSGETVFTADCTPISTDIGRFHQMDFSALQAEGSYRLVCGAVTSMPFAIAEHHWLPVADKLRAFFNKERCGCAVADTHLECHTDCFCVHPDGRKLSVAGGWHDAGDLSQGLCNTAESVHAFLDAAERMKKINTELYRSLLQEARYGLEWMLRTRFGDGYRCVWITNGVWTRGIVGDDDDLLEPASDKPFEGLCAVAAEAAGYLAYREVDAEFADYALQCAVADYGFILPKLRHVLDEDFTEKHLQGGLADAFAIAPVQMYAEAALAAAMLYKATGTRDYLGQAAGFARAVMDCQQTVPTDWKVPFEGFFYEDNTKTTPLAYDHRGHEQAPVMALALLLELAPKHSQSGAWKAALERYRAYIRALQPFAESYGVLPAGIYFADKPTTVTGTGDHMKTRFTLEAFAAQVKNGVELAPGVYLRRMPVVYKYRGSFGVQLSKAKAVSAMARALQDPQMHSVAARQLEWVLGANPFARSYMYGEGYDFPNMFTAFSFDMPGEVPVGIHSYEDTDVPYMPMTAKATYFEVWVHPASRMLWTIADLL